MGPLNLGSYDNAESISLKNIKLDDYLTKPR